MMHNDGRYAKFNPRLLPLLSAAVLLLFFATAASAAYTFVNVIDNTGPLSSFSNAPSINASGTVAFTGFRDDGTRGVYTVTRGGAVSTIADNTGPLTQFGL